MKTLLVINSSARITRSITRHLTSRFADEWLLRHPDGRVVTRDVGTAPTPMIDESWIAAAFTPPELRTVEMQAALELSNSVIDEIVEADAIVLGVPMYNFRMPGHLKGYLDQVVRVGRAFAFDAAAPEPYTPLLQSKPVVVITSAGDGALQPGGPLAHLNFLDGHLETLLGFIGLTDLRFVRVGYDEYGDGRLKRSLAAAESAVTEIVGRLSGGERSRVDSAAPALQKGITMAA
ncbi:MAG: FMN-dependent NADH-azoreductase [Chthoniobacteraceae bacterium]